MAVDEAKGWVVGARTAKRRAFAGTGRRAGAAAVCSACGCGGVFAVMGTRLGVASRNAAVGAHTGFCEVYVKPPVSGEDC